jgi:iron complex outermembrane receptor protein
MTFDTRILLIACSSVVALGAAMPAMAQTAAPAGPAGAQGVFDEEIVVTAQKRSESVQDVGISIAAYSGDQLRLLGVAKSSDIAQFTPGVFISGSLAGQNTQFTIRGVTQNDFNDIVEAPNAVYLDDGYIAIAQGQSFALFDIERVEVLKGPQGTLFGRNATGGLVNYITRKPSLEKWEGFVDVRYGIMDSKTTPGNLTVEGAIGGPINDKLAVRGAFRINSQQPWLINQYPAGAVGGPSGPGAGANLNDDSSQAGRLSVLLKPSDKVEFILSGNYSQSKMATGPYQQKPTIAVYNAAGEQIDTQDVAPNERRASIIPPGSGNSIGGDNGSDLNNDGIAGGPGEIYGRPVAGRDFFGYLDPDGSGPLISSDFAFKEHGYVDTWGVNLNGKFELSDSVTLTSITDYKKFDKLLFIDVDAGPANQLANYGFVDAKSFSQELRLNGSGDGFNWVTGVYFLYIDNLSKNGLKAPANGLVPGNPIDIASTSRLKTKSYSIFGQFDYDLSSEFRVVAGARIIREEKKYDFIQELYFSPDSRAIQPGAPLFPIGPLPGPNPRYLDNNGETLWAGKLQFEYRPNSDALLYLGINRGVKAGSYNAQLNGGLPTPGSAIRYGSETLWNYEGGFKLSLADNKVRLNGSVYYYDYKNYQSFLFTGVSGIVINADARTYGAELSVQANPVKGLDLSLSASAFNSKVKNVPLRVGGPVVIDAKPTYAPETQISGLVRYAWDMFGGSMALRADATYSSSYFYNLRNFSADKFKGYVMVNAGASWSPTSDNLELGVDIFNLTNKRDIGLQGFDLATLCGCNEVSYKPPRTFAVHARYKF